MFSIRRPGGVDVTFWLHKMSAMQAWLLFSTVPRRVIREIVAQAPTSEPHERLFEWWNAGVCDALHFAARRDRN